MATSFDDQVDSFFKKTEEKFADKVRSLITETHDLLIKHTPVWTGNAVANWEAGTAKSGSTAFTPTYNLHKPTVDPWEFDDAYPVGAEEADRVNRPAAKSKSESTRKNWDFTTPYGVYWVLNASPDIGRLDAGALPVQYEKGIRRVNVMSPGGIVHTVKGKIEAKIK